MSAGELKSFDRVAEIYDATRAMPPEVAGAVTEALLRELRSVSETPRLLEVGIGTGRIAVPLAAAGVRVTGIDISTGMLGLLRKKRDDIDVMLAVAARPPLRDASFDAALFVHILHLVPDASATVRATLPLVRPGGVILHGQDAHPAIRGEADALIESAITEITGLATDVGARRDEGRTLCERAVQDAGGTSEVLEAARWPSRATGRRMLGRLARKDYSSSWRIPDAKLPAVLERVTPQIEALFGGLDREVEFERAFSLFVGRLPG
ncbi:MAG: class I SAM-dependent methyltransferase [Chloroflexota bacterium]